MRIRRLTSLCDAMPERLQAAVLLGAFSGLRLAEACGHRTEDTDFMRGVVHPRYQYPAEPLKTDYSKTPVPVGRALALQLSAHAGRWPAETLHVGQDGGQLSPWALERAVRTARAKVRKCAKCAVIQVRPGRVFRCQACGGADDAPGLPAGFRYHDLRHYLASQLRQRRGRQDGAGEAAARVGYDHAEHVQSPVVRQGRVHEGDRGLGH